MPGQAVAAGLLVNTLADDTTNGDGFCTLREAITAANNNADFNDCVGTNLPYGVDTITFTVVGTIVLGSGLPAISAVGGPLTINGASDITISGANQYGVFSVSLGATLRLEGLTVTEGSGSGAIVNAGTLTLNNSTLSENVSSGSGGGINNDAGGTVTITNSTLSGNTAVADGGGITNDAGGDITIINSTLSGNLGNGGAIASFGPGSTVTIINSTLAGNLGRVNRGGILNDIGSSTTITNSMVANSSGANCTGGLVVNGSNMDTDGTCAGFIHVTTAQLNLGPLLDNGGPTLTHALLPGSVAIDAGVQSICAAEAITTDQRGFARDNRCDIGSFESGAGAPPPPTVQADLSIAKSAEKTAQSGRHLTYTIKVQNKGPNTATGIVVNDVLPAGTSFVSVGLATPGPTSCTTPAPGFTGSVSCSFASLASGSSLTDIIIVVRVTAKGNAQLNNTATVTATEFDPNTANNSSTATSKLGK